MSRFVVVETHGFEVRQGGNSRSKSSGKLPVVYTVLDSAVNYRICGEFSPKSRAVNADARRAVAEALAARLEAECEVEA